MKHVYPPRHPAWLDDKTGGPTATSSGNATESAQPPQRGASGAGEVAASGRESAIGRPAQGETAAGGADADHAPTQEPAGRDRATPHRGPGSPRR